MVTDASGTVRVDNGEKNDPRRYPSSKQNTVMWGWIAGAVVLVLLLVFMFGGSNSEKEIPLSHCVVTNHNNGIYTLSDCRNPTEAGITISRFIAEHPQERIVSVSQAGISVALVVTEPR